MLVRENGSTANFRNVVLFLILNFKLKVEGKFPGIRMGLTTHVHQKCSF